MTSRRVWSQGELSDFFLERLEEVSDAVWRRSDILMSGLIWKESLTR